MKLKIVAILLCLLMLTFGSGLVYAVVTTDVINHFETGVVDIDLHEYQIVDGVEVDWQNGPVVLPGMTVSKIARITNKANDCWVRAKIDFRGTEYFDESNLVGISDKWIKADDGYWYYKEILSQDEVADIFTGVSVPVDLPQEDTENLKFYLDVSVDAIQSKNFTPLFNMSEPWGDVDIKKLDKSEYNISVFEPGETSFAITYQGDVKRLVKNADDFFVNFPYLMPGDTYSDSVLIENDNSEDIKIYFKTEDMDVNAEILDKISLKITTIIDGKETVVYDGDLRANKLNTAVMLGVIQKSETGEFKFEISVPAELDNAYTVQNSAVKWIFSADDGRLSNNVQTGDMSVLFMSICTAGFFGCGFAFLYVYFVLRKREQERG